ncbi:hypothetical protein BJV77DRAFT_1119013, partial [Russula vinacea]
MSSLIFVGFFSLRAGHRVHTTVTKRSGDKASLYHNHYSTAIICRHPPYLPGEVRYYTRATDSVCADNSVAFMVAKGYIPAAMFPEISCWMLCDWFLFQVTHPWMATTITFPNSFHHSSLAMVPFLLPVKTSQMGKSPFQFRLPSMFEVRQGRAPFYVFSISPLLDGQTFLFQHRDRLFILSAPACKSHCP